MAAAVAAAVLAVPVGFGIYTWRQADALETAVSYGQYGQAQAAYRRAPWLRLLDEQQAAYVDAQTLMAQLRGYADTPPRSTMWTRRR